MADKKEFEKIAVEPRTHRQVSILAKVLKNEPKVTMFGLVGAWADEAWEEAKKRGLVTDAMLQSQEPSPTKEKKRTARAVEIAVAI